MSIQIWIGNYANYPIPEYLQSAKLTKSGWPDKRDKLYQQFMEWAKDK